MSILLVIQIKPFLTIRRIVFIGQKFGVVVVLNLKIRLFLQMVNCELSSSGAGMGEIEVVIIDPSGKKDTVECHIEDKGNSSYRCTYKPTQEGQHTIYITFAGGQISKSPYTVNVGEGKARVGKT